MKERIHTDSRFEAELQRLRHTLLYMGAEIEANIRDAMRALSTGDKRVAEQVAAREHRINCLELEIDDLCMRILALRQPAASDLRFVTTAMKIVTDLERIGDLTSHIVKLSIGLCTRVNVAPLKDVITMGNTAQGMLDSALDAFVEGDPELASQVVARDKEVDRLNKQVFQSLVTLMEEGQQEVASGVELILVARNLERMGDHAKNLAEMVVFLVSGQDIRHKKSRNAMDNLPRPWLRTGD